MTPQFEFDKPGLTGINNFPHVKDGEDAALAHENAAELAKKQQVTVREVGIPFRDIPGNMDESCSKYPNEYGPDGKPVK
jgi:hypothetical protein